MAKNEDPPDETKWKPIYPKDHPYRYFYARLPTCQACGSTDLVVYDTDRESESTESKRVHCRGCRASFFVVWEPGESLY